MRPSALVSGLACAAAVQGGPSAPSKATEPQPFRVRQASLPTITVRGNAFYAGESRFYVRGVAYQPGGAAANIDPLADPEICLPDIEKFKKLGINVIRVYSTDNSVSHDTCMNALAEAGIYVALDANNPQYSINRNDPGPSYNAAYLQSVFATIDEFIKYPNTMAFFSGNEVIHDEIETTLAARYVKATTRDMRQYIRNRKYRTALVGYSAADVSQNRMQTAHYFNCGTEDERSDFFAFNDYSWCKTDFKTAGWDVKVQNFTNYGIPIFLSEYGCITNGRDFGELEALMGDQMTAVYSGGLMYEYTMEANKFGIVEIASSNGKGDREELPEFTSFANALSQFAAPTGSGGHASTTNSIACPTQDSHWMVDSTLLPAIPQGALQYMNDGAGKGPGLKGPGSQNAGGTSTGDASPGSGSATATGSAGSSNAASGQRMGPIDRAPFVMCGFVVFFTLVGTFLV